MSDAETKKKAFQFNLNLNIKQVVNKRKISIKEYIFEDFTS